MKRLLLVAVLSMFFLTDLLASWVEAVPLFARRYKVSCTVCHVGIPKLNSFGEAFAGNGYQFPEEDLSDQMVETGDENLNLLQVLPLAIRVDQFLRVRNDTNTKTDFESPFVMKLFSSAPLKKDISYYFYFLFDERGDVAGVEDAFIYFNNGYKDVDLDLRIGQYQVTDILFPREQRLTFQDYTYYVTAVSDSGFQLTYDRGAELSYSFDLTDNLEMSLFGGVANGNGIGIADSERNFDSDDFKNFYGKVSWDYNGQRVGFYAYSGKEENSAAVENEFYRIGPDFNFTFFDNVNLWGNFLYGNDSNAKFTTGAPSEVDSWGGFVGVTWPFVEDWILSLLYNRVQVMGKPQLDEHTMTINMSYYLMRNLKFMAEFTGDLESTRSDHPTSEHTGVLGIVLAY